MKKVLEKLKEKYFILLTIIFLLLLGIILDLVLFSHVSKEKNYNPYEIVVKPNDNFVFLGDSLTDFYSLDEWFDGLPVINSGVSGYTTDDILENIDSMVTIYNPTKVFLLIGTNDIQREKSEKEIFSNIQKIVNRILEKRPNTKIYIESLYPITNIDDDKINHDVVGIRTNKKIKNINKKLKKYCDNKGYTYIDIYHELVDEDDNLNLKYTKEGLHLNDTGYVKVTKVLYPYLKEEA